jgi:hypothetical protein
MVTQASRYYKTGTLSMTGPGGEEILYYRRRFIPDTRRDPVLAYHMVVQGERPDIIAAAYLGNPELFWRLCDAGATMRPDDLTKTAGKRITIPLVTGG